MNEPQGSVFERAVSQAWDMLVHGDPFLMHLLWVTFQVAAIPTAAATVIGLPIGLLLGLGSFRGSGTGRVLANAGLGLPPVIVGLVYVLLLIPIGPWGGLHLLFTLKGVLLAQTTLALPIIVALTSSAVRDLPPGLLDQARAYRARWYRVAVLATREARVGILAAVITAVGSALSEVGAVVLVGGNIENENQTLASAALAEVNAGRFVDGLAIGIVLLGVIVIVIGLLTWLQYGGRRQPRWAMS